MHCVHSDTLYIKKQKKQKPKKKTTATMKNPYILEYSIIISNIYLIKKL